MFILIFTLLAGLTCQATSIDRFTTITANGLNKSLYQAITDGNFKPIPVAETASGTINGVNVTFTLTYTPDALAGLNLYLDGLKLIEGSGNDFTISGPTITMITAPKLGQSLYATYTR